MIKNIVVSFLFISLSLSFELKSGDLFNRTLEERHAIEDKGRCKKCPPTAPYCSGGCYKGVCRGHCQKAGIAVDFSKDQNIENLLADVAKPPKGCHTIEKIPYAFNGRATCAFTYADAGGDYSVNACNGAGSYHLDGDYNDAGSGHFYPMGSILIKPGCTLYMFDGAYSGTGTDLSQTYTFNNHFGLTGNAPMAPGPQSFICTCNEPISTCKPSDGWENVVICDNSKGLDNVADCSYSISIGTSYSTSVSKTMQISATVEESIQTELEGVFSATVSASFTTGFDWTKTSDLVKTKDTTISVDTQVQPGNTLIIQQAVGYCGGNRIKTNMFRFKESSGNKTTFETKEYQYKYY